MNQNSYGGQLGDEAWDRGDVPVGILLRRRRVGLGLTQEDVAERTGLSVRAIRNVEIGRTGRPHRRSMDRLIRALELNGVPAGGKPPSAGRPCELPVAAVPLAGRARELAECCDRLVGRVQSPLVLLSGCPGAGKTAAVVHVAHRVRGRFPDGQVYVDLDQTGGTGELFDRILRSLGAGSPQHRSVEERAALLRTILAQRRLLLVLDNVTTENQIRPLLGAGSTSAVLAACRLRLDALLEYHVARLGGLATADAMAMLGRLVADGRLAADLAAARTVVRLCSGLPLALRIAANWLLARPHRQFADLAGLLADPSRRLNVLEVGDLSIGRSVHRQLARLPASALREAMQGAGDVLAEYNLAEPLAALAADRSTLAGLLRSPGTAQVGQQGHP